MKNNSQNQWTINEEEFKQWLGGREAEFEPALDPVPTLKALVFLALLDNDDLCTYEGLGKIFQSKGVVQGTIPVASLRVALSELRNVLNATGHRFEIMAFKDGQREVKFKLARRNAKQHGLNNIVYINEPGVKSVDIAQHLMEHQSLPFHSLYYLPRSACWWVTFSSKDAEDRKHYEAGAWEELQLDQLVASSPSPVVGVVGLAVGEGLGEIELLRKMLDDGYTVHYLAVDLSPVLLTAHIETLIEIFNTELLDGQLLCAGAVVDAFQELEKALHEARSRFVTKGVFLRGEDFIPESSAVVATFLGNCLGNDAPDRENVVFSAVCKSFPNNRPVALLVGVSVMRTVEGRPEPDEYSRQFDDFLLQTPHHLLKNIGILHSRPVSPGEDGFCAHEEFTLPETSLEEDREHLECRLRRCPEVKPKTYTASHDIEGQIYRFYYRLDFDLEMPGKKLQLPAGTEIALYSITKYDLNSLVRAIRKRRFKVNYREDYHQQVEVNQKAREYAVFVAYLESDDTLLSTASLSLDSLPAGPAGDGR